MKQMTIHDMRKQLTNLQRRIGKRIAKDSFAVNHGGMTRKCFDLRMKSFGRQIQALQEKIATAMKTMKMRRNDV